MVNDMLDIIVPFYNEGQGILKLFDEIQKEIRTPKRVLAVYDFEEDTTLPVIKKTGATMRLKLNWLKIVLAEGRLMQ